MTTKTTVPITRLAEMRPPTMRSVLRHFALDVLAIRERLKPVPDRPRVHFLLLHHVFDDEIDAFRKLLARLQQDFQFISYTEAVERVLQNRIDGAYLATSFDDGLKCCRQAAGVLEEFGATACFFVCPGLIGETNKTVIETVCRERLRHPPVEFLSWDEVDELRDRGHEFGGHTMNHINLADVSTGFASDDIVCTYEMLTLHIGEVQHFAWPYGRFRDISAESARAVFAAGYRSCASGVRGCHGAITALTDSRQAFDANQLCIYRDSLVAGWPYRHVRYFLQQSARRPLTVEETWPPEVRPLSFSDEGTLCTLPLMPSRFRRAAG